MYIYVISLSIELCYQKIYILNFNYVTNETFELTNTHVK